MLYLEGNLGHSHYLTKSNLVKLIVKDKCSGVRVVTPYSTGNILTSTIVSGVLPKTVVTRNVTFRDYLSRGILQPNDMCEYHVTLEHDDILGMSMS